MESQAEVIVCRLLDDLCERLPPTVAGNMIDCGEHKELRETSESFMALRNCLRRSVMTLGKRSSLHNLAVGNTANLQYIAGRGHDSGSIR